MEIKPCHQVPGERNWIGLATKPGKAIIASDVERRGSLFMRAVCTSVDIDICTRKPNWPRLKLN